MTREQAIERARELTLAMWWSEQVPDWKNINQQLELMANNSDRPAAERAELLEVINQLP